MVYTDEYEVERQLGEHWWNNPYTARVNGYYIGTAAFLWGARRLIRKEKRKRHSGTRKVLVVHDDR